MHLRDSRRPYQMAKGKMHPTLKNRICVKYRHRFRGHFFTDRKRLGLLFHIVHAFTWRSEKFNSRLFLCAYFTNHYRGFSLFSKILRDRPKLSHSAILEGYYGQGLGNWTKIGIFTMVLYWLVCVMNGICGIPSRVTMTTFIKTD